MQLANEQFCRLLALQERPVAMPEGWRAGKAFNALCLYGLAGSSQRPDGRWYVWRTDRGQKVLGEEVLRRKELRRVANRRIRDRVYERRRRRIAARQQEQGP